MQPQQAEPQSGFAHAPNDIVGPRELLWGEQFAADPHRAYREMRERYGTLVPVELAPGVPATLVVGYHTAVKILNDPERFPADPRVWQKTAPQDTPIMPMLEWRPNALRATGVAHNRYRSAINDAITGVDLHALRVIVEKNAIPLINSFCEEGQADLIGQYALPLVFGTLNGMLGATVELGARVAQALAMMFDTSLTDEATQILVGALMELIAMKRANPGEDVTSRLLHHEAGLGDEELVQQMLLVYAAGIEPSTNLIANTLVLMLTDPNYAVGDSGFPPSTRAAVDEILVKDPPMANFCITYPRQPVLIDDVWLPPNQPVIVSMSACNNDPAVNNGDYINNRWNLAWGTGPHACPGHARSSAQLIAGDAIDQLLDALPEMRLAIPVDHLAWRPGPFHRALASLPVVFSPSPQLKLLH